MLAMSEEKKDEDLTICGGDDFLADQGIADPDEFRVKSHICHEISTIAEQRGLSPADVARLASEPEQDLDRIMNYRHDGYEVWRLIKVLTALGADVAITILPDGGHERGVVLPETVRQDKEQLPRELAEMDEVDYQPSRACRSGGKASQKLLQATDGVGHGAAAHSDLDDDVRSRAAPRRRRSR
jgi:hypothetical protein